MTAQSNPFTTALAKHPRPTFWRLAILYIALSIAETLRCNIAVPHYSCCIQ